MGSESSRTIDCPPFFLFKRNRHERISVYDAATPFAQCL